MWVHRWYERPFGPDEPHIGGWWESELMCDSDDEIIMAFIDYWVENGFSYVVTAIDDISDDDIELDARYTWNEEQIDILERVVNNPNYSYSQLRDTLEFLTQVKV